MDLNHTTTSETLNSQRRVRTLLSHFSQQPIESSFDFLPSSSTSSSSSTTTTPEFDPSNFMHGGELVAEALKAHGVQFLFTLIGGHISPIVVGAKERGIRVVDVRHEVNAVFAADAVSRLTPTPGVAAVTAGPGLTNTITAVKNAMMAQSPVIILGGATASLLKGRGSLQDIDQQALFAPHVKWQASIWKVSDIIPTIEKAFKIAQSDVPGPVFLEFTLDVLYHEVAIRTEALGKLSKDTSISGRMIKWYVERHVNKVYEKNENIRLSHPLTPEWGVVANSEVERVITSYLQSAKKPVVIVGSQALIKNQNATAVATAIDRLGIPTYLSGMARGLLGTKHPLHMRHHRAKALKESDLLILLGVPCDFRLSYGTGIPSHTPIVSVNLDKTELFKNRTPTIALQAEPGDFIIQLSTQAAERRLEGKWKSWGEKLRQRDNERDQEIVTMAQEKYPEFVNPVRLLTEADKEMGDKTILVADGGDFVATASYILHPRGPLSWMDPGPFGTLGVGAGFALGAKLARPEAEVWLLWGDGSVGFSMMEFDTFVRHNVPVIALVGNDACWSQIYRDQVVLFGDGVGCALGRTDYHKLSIAFGGSGFVIDKDQDITRVLREARATASGGLPVLINAHIAQTDFRKGSISI